MNFWRASWGQCWIWPCWFPHWGINSRQLCWITEVFWNADAPVGHWSPSRGPSCTPSTCKLSHSRTPPVSTQPGSSGGASTAGWLPRSGMLQVRSARIICLICLGPDDLHRPTLERSAFLYFPVAVQLTDADTGTGMKCCSTAHQILMTGDRHSIIKKKKTSTVFTALL